MDPAPLAFNLGPSMDPLLGPPVFRSTRGYPNSRPDCLWLASLFQNAGQGSSSEMLSWSFAWVWSTICQQNFRLNAKRNPKTNFHFRL